MHDKVMWQQCSVLLNQSDYNSILVLLKEQKLHIAPLQTRLDSFNGFLKMI